MTTLSSRDLFKSHAPLLPPDAQIIAPQPRKWLHRLSVVLIGVVCAGAGGLAGYSMMVARVERADATARRASLIADAAVSNVTTCIGSLMKHYAEVKEVRR